MTMRRFCGATIIIVALSVGLGTACANRDEAAAGSVPTSESSPSYEAVDQLPTDGTNLIHGDPVSSVAEADAALPFTILIPSNLGDPTGIFLASDGPPEARVVEFDYKSDSVGDIVVTEYTPPYPLEEWPKIVDTIVSTNGLPITHGSGESIQIRGGKLALLTISEDKTNSTVEWYESADLQVSVFGPNLPSDAAIDIANKL